jgi:hypothetical protein
MAKLDDPEAEFTATIAAAAARFVDRLGVGRNRTAAKRAASLAYQAAGNGVSDEFSNEPMTGRQGETLRNLCARLDNVEFPESATKQEAQHLIAELIAELESRKPSWIERQ